MNPKLLASLESLSTSGCRFISVPNYSRDGGEGETADYLLNVGVDLGTAKQLDAQFLENHVLSEEDIQDFAFQCDMEDCHEAAGALLIEAQEALHTALVKPSTASKNRSEAQSEAYRPITNGLKFHKETGNIYIYGFSVAKKVKEEGAKKEDRRKPLTKAKDFLRKKYMKSPKYRTLALEKIEAVKMNGETLVLS